MARSAAISEFVTKKRYPLFLRYRFGFGSDDQLTNADQGVLVRQGLSNDSNAIPREVDADHVLGEEVVPNESVESW